MKNYKENKTILLIFVLKSNLKDIPDIIIQNFSEKKFFKNHFLVYNNELKNQVNFYKLFVYSFIYFKNFLAKPKILIVLKDILFAKICGNKKSNYIFFIT